MKDIVRYYYHYRLWLKPILLLVLCFGLLLYLVWPIADRVGAQFQSLMYSRNKEKEAFTWVKKKDHLIALNNSFKDEVRNIKLGISKERRLSALFGLLNNAATQAGLKFETVKPGVEDETPRHVRVPFDLSIKSNYHSIGLFLNQLEKSGCIMQIERITLNAPRLDQKGVDAMITLSFFVIK